MTQKRWFKTPVKIRPLDNNKQIAITLLSRESLTVWGRARAVTVVGVTFFCEKAPDYFNTLCLAFISMFPITVGKH